MERLIEQFKNATGLNYTDYSSREFISSYFEWLNLRKEMIKDYIDFLDYMDLSYKGEDCAEVDKTVYDTIVGPFKTKIITQNTSGFENSFDKERIINGIIDIENNNPKLVLPSKKEIIIPSNIISTYITQNPYQLGDIVNWVKLHNSGNYDIILGVYGNIYDKDMDSKLRELEFIKSGLEEPYKEEFAVLDDSYFYTIGTHSDKKKVLRLTR